MSELAKRPTPEDLNKAVQAEKEIGRTGAGLQRGRQSDSLRIAEPGGSRRQFRPGGYGCLCRSTF